MNSFENSVRQLLAAQDRGVQRESETADHSVILALSNNLSIDIYRASQVAVVVMESGPMKGIYEYAEWELPELATLLEQLEPLHL